MKECALMGCQIPENTPTLENLLKSNKVEEQVRYQAQNWIQNQKFKGTDCICQDCFWK